MKVWVWAAGVAFFLGLAVTVLAPLFTDLPALLFFGMSFLPGVVLRSPWQSAEQDTKHFMY